MDKNLIYWKLFFLFLIALAILIPSLLILGIYKLFIVIGGGI